jgi:hypothetical protein
MAFSALASAQETKIRGKIVHYVCIHMPLKKSYLTEDKYDWHFGHFEFDMATVVHGILAIWWRSCKAWVLFLLPPCLAAPMLLTLEDL